MENKLEFGVHVYRKNEICYFEIYGHNINIKINESNIKRTTYRKYKNKNYLNSIITFENKEYKINKNLLIDMSII